MNENKGQCTPGGPTPGKRKRPTGTCLSIAYGLAGLGLTLMVQAAPILPEKTTHITLSNQDVNRLVCTQGMISDVNYSAEKGMQVKIDGANAFVKFQWLHNGQDKTYLTDPSELFLTCDGEVYSLVIEPKARRTRTVHSGQPGETEPSVKTWRCTGP